MSTIDTISLTRDLAYDDEGAAKSPIPGGNPVTLVIVRWHDETHAGAYSTCQEQPCAAVRIADDDA